MNAGNEPVCYIVGAAALSKPLSFKPASTDYIIAADGGFLHLKNAGIRIDLAIGDFDSLPFMPEESGNNNDVLADRSARRVRRLPVQKNETDLYAAISTGLEKGYRVFHIYGGTGGAVRHTLANIQCLKRLAENGARGYLHGENEVMTAIFNGVIAFPKTARGYISVFSLNEKARGVTLKNLKYPLSNYTMTDAYPIGVSNEFTDKSATVSVTDGTLLLVYDV